VGSTKFTPPTNTVFIHSIIENYIDSRKPLKYC